MLSTVSANTQTRSVTLLRTDLLRLLEGARHVVPARCPKPVLTCVRLEASDGLLTMNATDGELSLHSFVSAEGELPPCVVTHSDLVRRLKASRNDTSLTESRTCLSK